jgi:hypothetical protein
MRLLQYNFKLDSAFAEKESLGFFQTGNVHKKRHRVTVPFSSTNLKVPVKREPFEALGQRFDPCGQT